MKNDVLTMGLIGAGRIGALHAAHLAHRIEGVRLAAIADANEAAAKQCAERLGIPRATGDAAAIFADPAIDAVAICSSTDTHAAFIEAAARAGKHIFCEKPVDQDLAKIDRALGAAKAAGVTLMIGFNRRFDANFARVREAIVSGAVGEPHLIHIISRDPGPPPIAYIKVSGGIFMDMTIHDFDMARFLTGSEPVEIYAAAGVRVDPAIGEAGDLDTALITIKFANGALVSIDNSRRAVYGYDQRIEVFGAKGSIRVDNNYPNTALLSDAESVRRDLPLNFFMDRYTESYLAEIRAFVEAVRTGTPPPVVGEDGRAPVVMAMAARRSYDENRPVKMAEIG